VKGDLFSPDMLTQPICAKDEDAAGAEFTGVRFDIDLVSRADGLCELIAER
jgi:hypothetical protein